MRGKDSEKKAGRRDLGVGLSCKEGGNRCRGEKEGWVVEKGRRRSTHHLPRRLALEERGGQIPVGKLSFPREGRGGFILKKRRARKVGEACI